MAMEVVQLQNLGHEVLSIQVENLGHDHPLMLIKAEETEASWDLSCYGCEQPISISSSSSSSYYGCKRCTFFLHKSCAELPHQMTHPCHPQHPLTLFPNPPSAGQFCDVCTQYCNRFIYHCSLCEYDIDLKCALEVLGIQLNIDHPSHDHQLITLQKESMFLCDACGIKHEGTSYLCTTCGFWINQKCAASPLTLKLNNHPHTLTLIYLLPQEEYDHHAESADEVQYCQICHRHHAKQPKCQICSIEIYRRNWAYFCSECHYLAHLHCAVSNETENQSHNLGLKPINLSSSNSATATSDADLHNFRVICLPVPDDSADIITQFIKNTAIQRNHEGAAEIKHDSHRHPLTLYEEPIDHASSHFNVALNVQKCCGCAQSISAPFYCCLECEFYLHVWCAELPEELRQHPTHLQHTLFLSKYATAGKCNCCNLYGSTISYKCEECNFYLDCKCASLPRVIKHESHDKHILALRPTSSSGTCISCSASLTISFQCSGCKFNVCVRCAILPCAVRHRYDKHPFTLTYSPRPYRTDDDFCEICEEGIDSNRWFYHCGECDQYLHTDCILPIDQFSNMVYSNNWEPINSRKHPHRLISVGHVLNKSCSLCERSIADSYHFYCPPCQFRLCISCEECSTVICLPVPDDSADIITQFIKNMAAIQGKHEGAVEIKHGSHDHPLTLYEEPIDHASNVQKCCGCAQSISAPFYCCLECEFYLHVWCAELPEKLPHPGHPQHTLFLSKAATAGKCNCCNLIGSTLSYECQECNVNLDCKCASLPRFIKHESHDKHTLALRPTSFSGTCISCSASLRMSFECWGCKFNLCVRCAILPRTVRHRYDKHPFTLTYSPRPYWTDGDFCKICEDGIDSNRWFYHCGECDQYVHTDCILPVDQFSNMVYFPYWKPINSRKHPHRLIGVAAKPNTSCSLCKRSNADDHYRCPPCEFRLCDSCEEKEIEGEI